MIAVRPDPTKPDTIPESQAGETYRYYDARGEYIAMIYASETCGGYLGSMSIQSLPGCNGDQIGLAIPSLPQANIDPDPPHTFEAIAFEIEAQLQAAGWTLLERREAQQRA